VTAFSTFVEVLVVTTVEEIQAIENVFASMGVDNIQKNYKAKTMGCVYQLFEIFREAITGTGSEKVGNLISERWKQDRFTSAIKRKKVLTGVVSMLHYCHKLDAVVSEIPYPG
jgi:hypothetical protein